jgi:hypothetical protein
VAVLDGHGIDGHLVSHVQLRHCYAAGYGCINGWIDMPSSMLLLSHFCTLRCLPLQSPSESSHGHVLKRSHAYRPVCSSCSGGLLPIGKVQVQMSKALHYCAPRFPTVLLSQLLEGRAPRQALEESFTQVGTPGRLCAAGGVSPLDWPLLTC